MPVMIYHQHFINTKLVQVQLKAFTVHLSKTKSINLKTLLIKAAVNNCFSVEFDIQHIRAPESPGRARCSGRCGGGCCLHQTLQSAE